MLVIPRSLPRAVVGALILLAGVETSSAVSLATFRCQATHAKVMDVFGRDRGKCLVKCEKARLAGDPTRVCFSDADWQTPSTLDPVTLACIARVDERARRVETRACPPEVYPQCSTYGPDMLTHLQFEIDTLGPLMDASTVPLFLCDPEYFACGSKTVDAVMKFSRDMTTCFRECAKALRLEGDTSRQCVPVDNDIESLDPVSSACMVKARDRALARVLRACPVMGFRPTCGLYAFDRIALVNFASSWLTEGYDNEGGGVYCEP